MKSFAFMIGVTIAAACAKAEVTFSDVVVRQLWPWRNTVCVDCMVNGVESETPVRVTLQENGVQLAEVPDIAYVKGAKISASGVHHVEFDPMFVPELRARGAVANVEVVLTAAAPERVLYAVFDLTKSVSESGQLQYVTESALRGGQWGTWEVDATSGEPIWTGVTTDRKYAERYLPFRRVSAGTFFMNNNQCVGSVTLTKDYFMSVFLVTESQYARLKGETPSDESSKPRRNVSYDQLRGTVDGAQWPSVRRVDASSEMAAFSTRLGLAVDLPTSAQWEYAVRAGADGQDEGGTARWGFIGYSAETLTQYAWYQPNSGCYMQPVGTLKPNPWGFYDAFGDAWCFCCDWCASTTAGVDPGGASGGFKRFVRGGCVTTTNSGYVNAIFGWGSIEPNKADDTIGFRLVSTLDK